MSAGTRKGQRTDATREFFEGLPRRGHEPLLEKATGSLRFDLLRKGRTDRWIVTIDRGDVTVTHKNEPADCVVRMERALFDRIATGEVNAFAAVLRGEAAVEGDPRLLVLLQRVFPSPSRQGG
jgi:putative sterol carrier protein